jgi:hypothetical protein
LNLLQFEGTFTGSLSKMYQLDLGSWRFSAAFPVHSEIGKRSQYSNRESSLLYFPMRRAFSDQGASRITRTAVFIFNLVSLFGAAVAPLHLSAKKSGEACPCSLQPTPAHHMSAQTFSFITSFEVFPSASTFLLQMPRTFSYEVVPSKRGF